MNNQLLLERTETRNRLSARRRYESKRTIKTDELGGHMKADYMEQGKVSGPKVEEVRKMVDQCKVWLGVNK